MDQIYKEIEMKTITIAAVIICLTFSVAMGEVGETVKVGAILGKTGKAAPANLIHLRGIRYAIEELNRQGGLLGKQIELIEFDNRSTPLGSKRAAQQAIEAGVIAVIGAVWSSHSLAMAPVLNNAGIPMISPSSTNPDVTRVGNCIFRACFVDSFQGAVMAEYAIQHLNAKTAGVLTNASRLYSIGLSDVFIEKFRQRGGKILYAGDYHQDTADFNLYIKKIKIEPPDVIFVPGGWSDSVLIVKQARKMGVKAIFLGGDSWSNIIANYKGSEIDGNYYTDHWHKDLPSDRSRRFFEHYSKEYGQVESSGIPLAYDAVMLLADAVCRVKSFDRFRIIEALATTENFSGVTGSITMNKNGDPIKPAVIIKIKSGENVFIDNIK